MLDAKYRPVTFSEVRGQSLAKEALKAIVANPKNSPRSIILYGPHGLGKTTLARVFGVELNKKSSSQDIKKYLTAPYYYEFDSALVGNVEFVRNIREQLYYSFKEGYYRVIVMDECHMVSQRAQAVFLKMLEEVPDRTFIVFCTTDIEKFLKTIRSRSLEIELNLLTEEQIRAQLNYILSKEEREIPEDVKRIIVRRCGGHMRDAILLVERFILVGEEKFRLTVHILDEEYLNLFEAFHYGSTGKAEEIVERIVMIPVAFLYQDFMKLLKRIAEQIYLDKENFNKEFITSLKTKFKQFYAYCLRFLSNLNNAEDWYIFLVSLKEFFKRETASKADRFKK